MRVLVFGAGGFAGRHLQAELARQNSEVIVAPGPRAESGFDLRDATRVKELVLDAKADAIVNLAAVSSRAESDADPALTFAVNALGVVHVLAAAQRATPRPRVLIVSSGEVYGALAAGELASEDSPLKPANPYAAAKLAAEISGQQFHRSYGLEVVVARPFNHLGPGQSDRFVVPALAKQIAAIQRGDAPNVLRMGDLSPRRDFTHVRDVASAYWLLLEKGTPGEVYNVASGAPRSIRSVLDEMLELSGVDAHVEVEAPKFRALEIPARAGNPARIKALGWEPRFDVRTALREALVENGASVLR